MHARQVSALTIFSQGEYRDWAKDAKFESRLEVDVAARKAAANDTTKKQKQSTLDPHLEEKERFVPYTDANFRNAALEWLIKTDQVHIQNHHHLVFSCSLQPVSALEDPKFIEMINIASRATGGVKIPKRGATRAAIIDLFQKNLDDLKRRMSVSVFLFLFLYIR